MEDKTPAIVAMLVILVLIYLSNSGKLLAIKNLMLQSGASSPGSAGGGATAPPSGTSMPPRQLPSGPIGLDESQQSIYAIEQLFKAWSPAS